MRILVSTIAMSNAVYANAVVQQYKRTAVNNRHAAIVLCYLAIVVGTNQAIHRCAHVLFDKSNADLISLAPISSISIFIYNLNSTSFQETT